MSIDIQDLLGPGISAKTGDLAKYSEQNIVKVKAHVGRNRGIIPLPTKQLGIKPEKLGENGQAFYNGNLQASRLSLIPTDDEERFRCLEARLRNAIRNSELCEGFIPVVAYDSLKSSYEDTRREYFEARDEVLSRWDALVHIFQSGAEEMLGGVRMKKRDREQMFKIICSQIPSKETYKHSFYMSLSVTAFPAAVIPEGLEASVAADIEKSCSDMTVSTVLKAIEKAIGEGFAMLGKAATAYAERGTISGKTLDAMARYGKDMSWKNVFQNEAISALAQRMKLITSLAGTDAKEVAVEEGLVDLWDYANQRGFKLDATVTPFTPDVLDMMLSLRQQNQKAQVTMN